jgi:tripeptide aminopeptidase
MPPLTNPMLEAVGEAGAERTASPATIFSTCEWTALSAAIDQHREWTDKRHLELTAIPAPTFHEAARAEWIAEQFRTLGLKNVRLDEAGNVLADRPGTVRNRIWLTAHLDTVFPSSTEIRIKRDGRRILAPGINDNGAGLAALLTMAAVLQRCAIPTKLGIRFAANVGEEGEGDLRGMRQLFSNAEARHHTSAVIVLDGAGVENITDSGLGSRRFLIEVAGPGGHSWNDFGRANPIHALARAIAGIEQIALPGEPRATISVGVIEGGSTINSIPQSAWMKVDVRSTSTLEIERLSAALDRAIADGVAHETGRGGGELEVRKVVLGERPAAAALPQSRLVETFLQADHLLGIRSNRRCASTDANWPLSLGIDAVAIGGGGTGGGAHTLDEWFDPQGRELGIKRALLALLSLAGGVEQTA